MGNEGLFSVMNIASSGLYAERTRMNIIANNIANANTTKTADGTPYRRKFPVFSSALQKEMGGRLRDDRKLGGVKVDKIKTSTDPFKKLYIPGHPDADKDGFVLNSNVSSATEMVDMIVASRAYEANLSIMRSANRMISRTLQAFRQ